MAFKLTIKPWVVSAIILASCAGIVALAAQAATDGPGIVYWSDGDSGRLPDGTKFRLHDVDSPETGSLRQRGGAKCESERVLGYTAKEAAVELTRDKDVVISHSYGPDHYGRLVVDLEVGGRDVALTLIASGTHKAWDYDGGQKKPDWCGGAAAAGLKSPCRARGAQDRRSPACLRGMRAGFPIRTGLRGPADRARRFRSSRCRRGARRV